MEMEWVDGFDLARLLTRNMLRRLEARVSRKRWQKINEVIVTDGPVQPRVKPGIAIAIVRDCLAALAALHREGIVHGDLKPSNIMLKRTGNAKIVDIGSAFELEAPPPKRTCTPTYAAPEVLEGGECSPRSDLASLGYVLIEMLSGMPPFAGLNSLRDLLEAKRFLAQRLSHILPQEVVCNELLMSFCRGLVAPDPARRFPSAEAADLVKEGAASFHRQLVKGDLASEYDNEIRIWLEDLEELDEVGRVESHALFRAPGTGRLAAAVRRRRSAPGGRLLLPGEDPLVQAAGVFPAGEGAAANRAKRRWPFAVPGINRPAPGGVPCDGSAGLVPR